jgi:hypothetical protein
MFYITAFKGNEVLEEVYNIGAMARARTAVLEHLGYEKIFLTTYKPAR